MMHCMIKEESGLRIALEIVASFNSGDAEADMRTIEIEAAIIGRMKELGIQIEMPNYCEGLI